MPASKLELIEALDREEIVYKDRDSLGMIEFVFDHFIDLGFFYLSCDYRGYVRCYVENGKVSRIEATTIESEVPDDVTKMDIP